MGAIPEVDKFVELVWRFAERLSAAEIKVRYWWVNQN